MWPSLSIPRFNPEIEPQFQAGYYARIRSTLQLVSPLMVVLLLVQLALSARRPAPYDLAVVLPQLGFWSLVYGLTWVPSFARWWQPIVVGLGWLSAALVLGQLAPLLTQDIARMRESGLNVPTDPQQKFYFMLQFAVLMVSLATLRLEFRWAALLCGGVTAIGSAAFLRGLPASPELFRDVRFAFLPGVLIACVLLLAALIQEQLARSAFWASHQLELANLQLEAERNDERRKREQTEKMLHVLNGAIGGIVHDLGNPLAKVQMGASTLEIFVEDGADIDTLRLCTEAITSGAQMLNYLRLSLIEQSRVLEGKPVPVEIKPVAVRAVVAAGVSFQQPRLSHGHVITLEEGGFTIHADEMKMVTVFMNLIGNALKYSDGEVRIAWREFERVKEIGASRERMLCIAVLDQGTKGQGITREQAGRLFTAFGRLDNHSQIEGTGLGLLSVQKIVQAHGGETFIEGYKDGTPNSRPFSTATEHDSYPTMLSEAYRTAFVVTCPLSGSA